MQQKNEMNKCRGSLFNRKIVIQEKGKWNRGGGGGGEREGEKEGGKERQREA